MKENNVHIAFGFHVNCYHSYRGDSNDKHGFGGDIRIIRQIIKVLDEFNEKSIPAKATWDFENAYSLEDIIPKYAPDIIEGVKRRCKENGDENIIMGYNNGALSAMNEAELTSSINMAVSNDKGSGLRDLFGDCQMVVRPQEVMFSPSQVSVYNKLGVKALCIYYSCMSFDGFRTFIPQLDDEKAFNPVRYTYKGESITIMPTYSNADVVDAGCLRSFARELHHKQETGEINNDVMLFINMDADAVFWEPVLPPPFNKLANANGIYGLVKEVADLDFVRFDTVGNYLDTHKPLCDISFTEDTADGGFTGYISWAEKPFNCQIWTRLERARAYAKCYKSDFESPSFNDRIMLLSTTHFGLASPVLNVQREKKALEFSKAAVEKELIALEKPSDFTINNISGKRYVSAELELKDGFIKNIWRFNVKSKGLQSFSAVPMDYYDSGCVKTVMLLAKFDKSREKYELTFSDNGNKEEGNVKESENALFLKTKDLEITFSKTGYIPRVKYKGRIIGDKQFIRRYVTYNNKRYLFDIEKAHKIKIAGSGSAVEVYGSIDIPGQLEGGRFSYIFFTVEGCSEIYVTARIKYPYTYEDTALSTESSSLGRKTDNRWTEAVPFSLTPILPGKVSVVKRNYMDDISSYDVSDFGKVLKGNENLDSFNHHITNGFVALTNGKIGFGIGIAKQVNNSMAVCPMRLRDSDLRYKVSMNPFGTYFGRQRNYPTRSNGCASDAFLIVSPQSKSIAPSYNGVEQWFATSIFAFDGEEPTGEIFDEVIGFAEGGAAVDSNSDTVKSFKDDNVKFHIINEVDIDEKDLMSPAFSGDIGDKGRLVKTAVKSGYNIISKEIKSYLK